MSLFWSWVNQNLATPEFGVRVQLQPQTRQLQPTRLWEDAFRGARVVCYCDNDGAKACLMDSGVGLGLTRTWQPGVREIRVLGLALTRTWKPRVRVGVRSTPTRAPGLGLGFTRTWQPRVRVGVQPRRWSWGQPELENLNPNPRLELELT